MFVAHEPEVALDVGVYATPAVVQSGYLQLECILELDQMERIDVGGTFDDDRFFATISHGVSSPPSVPAPPLLLRCVQRSDLRHPSAGELPWRSCHPSPFRDCVAR